jgi:hypothetical protein
MEVVFSTLRRKHVRSQPRVLAHEPEAYFTGEEKLTPRWRRHIKRSPRQGRLPNISSFPEIVQRVSVTRFPRKASLLTIQPGLRFKIWIMGAPRIVEITQNQTGLFISKTLVPNILHASNEAPTEGLCWYVKLDLGGLVK